MKEYQYYHLIKVIAICFLLVSCEKDDSPNISSGKLDFTLNHSLPPNIDTLKILSIGNSFTQDAMWYMPHILRKMKINNVRLAHITYTACTLSKHYEFYKTDSACYYFFTNEGLNSNWKMERNYKLRSALKYADWDIIILQQLSNQAGLYSTYEPYLSNLLNNIYKEIKDKDVVFGWHMTWSYATNSDRVGFERYGNNQITMYDSIVKASQRVTTDIGIKLILPSGTTLQNLRNTKLTSSPLDFTRDGSHADLGAGRYALACTWINVLIKDYWNLKDVKIPYLEIKEGIPVSLDSYEICQKAAFDACSNKYLITK